MARDINEIKALLDSFRVSRGRPLFFIGPNGIRVSFQSQQRRAFNLIYCLGKYENLNGKTVAVIGGGVTGITAAVALSINGAYVSLYEERPINRQKIAQCTSRYIHPNINFLPEEELSFTTDLPAMNWHADTARDVMRQLDGQLSAHLHSEKNRKGRIRRHSTQVARIEDSPDGGLTLLFKDGGKETRSRAFDYVICCTGFSNERKLKSEKGTDEYNGSTGYWDGNSVPEEMACDHVFEQIVVVGGGDGGVIDALHHGPGIDGTDIHRLALHAALIERNNPLNANLDQVIDTARIRRGLKTVLVIQNESSATPWHKHLLKWFSDYHYDNSSGASIEVEISKKVYYDKKRQTIVTESKYSPNQRRDLDIEKSHVIVRTGGDHEVSLIKSYLGESGWSEFKYKEKEVSAFQLLKSWPDDYFPIDEEQSKAEHLYPMAINAFSKWNAIYRDISGKTKLQMQVSYGLAEVGKRLRNFGREYESDTVAATGNEMIYFAWSTPAADDEYLPGLPHIFGVPLVAGSKPRVVTITNK